MDDEPQSFFRKFYGELKEGNPFAILLVILALVLLGSGWVWQATHSSVVSFSSTPKFSHPSAISPYKMLTARALSAVPPARASATPIPVTTTPTPPHPLMGLDNRLPALVDRGKETDPAMYLSIIGYANNIYAASNENTIKKVWHEIPSPLIATRGNITPL